MDIKYEIQLYWSEEEKNYAARVPDLYGCISYGETLETALENVKKAIDLWLDIARECGDPIPTPNTRTV